MSNVITADKPIPAVIARSIDSNNPTPVSAYVERNVYAEEGRNIIIPAGSRVMGEMGNMEGGGSTGSAVRVNITWERLIRPDGSAFEFGEATTGDAQGKAGALGYIDEQLLKKYTLPIVTSTLTSALTFLSAAGETSTSSNGSTVQDSKAEAANEARENFVDEMLASFKDACDTHTRVGGSAEDLKALSVRFRTFRLSFLDYCTNINPNKTKEFAMDDKICDFAEKAFGIKYKKKSESSSWNYLKV